MRLRGVSVGGQIEREEPVQLPAVRVQGQVGRYLGPFHVVGRAEHFHRIRVARDHLRDRNLEVASEPPDQALDVRAAEEEGRIRTALDALACLPYYETIGNVG